MNGTKRIFLILAVVLIPLGTGAESLETDLSSTLSILNIYSLASAVLVGIITSAMVFINALKMKGGIFGRVLTYFAAGMALILIGFAVSSYRVFVSESAIEGNILESAYNALFIIAYVIMAFASHKLHVATSPQ